MTGSYNESLSTMFSKSVRDRIMEDKVNHDEIVYSDIFKNTKVKYGESSMSRWSLEGNQQTNYLATSPGGSSTGMGSDLMIIDDLIKNSYEANNANVLDGHFSWFTDTMISRIEGRGKLIVIMTRWSTNDMAGRLLKHYEEQGTEVRHINFKAMNDDGAMLCEDVLSKESFLEKSKLMSPEIVAANYQQEPIDIKGRLYTSLKTYDGELPQFKEIKNYTDTADTGSDYLCSINYGVTFDNEAYILDVLYTKDAMELTEPAVANMLHERGVNVADIESNNGGRGFARSVERILKTVHRSNRTRFNAFHQSKNKKARILSNSTWVMDHIYLPSNWRDKYPEFYKDVTEYQKEGKNAHDDAPDVLTGIAERAVVGNRFSFN